jgi:hypothetical protein
LFCCTVTLIIDFSLVQVGIDTHILCTYCSFSKWEISNFFIILVTETVK